MDLLDHHRPYRPDCNGKGLLTEEVSGPFDTYLELKAFINKHLPEKFYMEGDQRVDLAVVAGGCFRTLVKEFGGNGDA